VNKEVFGSKSRTKPADTRNDAGGKAYKRSAKEALAQIAVTGCFSGTYYASGTKQLDLIQTYLPQVDSEFIAKLAIYSRTSAYMKDMPAYLTAYLANQKNDSSRELLKKIFPQVIDNTKMLRNFVEIILSGATGRTNPNSRINKLINNKLALMSDDQLFCGDIGQDPSLGDIIRLSHPKPTTDSRRAVHAFLVGELSYSDGKFYMVAHHKNNKNSLVEATEVPPLLADYFRFRAGETDQVPGVPFRRLADMKLDTEQWTQVARNMPWMATRMNLNTLERHGVFNNVEVLELIRGRLRNPELIKKARCFPYQLLTAYQNIDKQVPPVLADALQDAIEIAVDNVPEFKGNIIIAPDVSGSMQQPVTGHRSRATKTLCVDVAGLIATVIARKSENCTVIPVDTQIHDTGRWNKRDSIMTGASKLASYGGGGTNLSLVMQHILDNKLNPDGIVIISDTESWRDTPSYWYRGTNMAEMWTKVKQQNKNAKLINIDIVPNTTKQVDERPDVLSIGGFSDQVFTVIKEFLDGGNDPNAWVSKIESISI